MSAGGVHIDPSIVKYSEIEGTYYFHDPRYPATIQFLLDQRWESHDVTWVRQNAHDPEVARLAAEAEAVLHRQRTRSSSVCQPPLIQTLSPQAPSTRPPSTPPTSAPSSDDLPVDPALRDAAVSVSSRPPYSPNATTLTALLRPETPHDATSPTPPNGRPYAPSDISSTSYAFHSSAIQPPLRLSTPLSHPEEAIDSGSDVHRRPMDGPLPINRKTKILLSLDGDGIRGLSAILLVESLINAICTQMQRRLDPYQIFDVIGGVSTMGLLAILIGRLRMRVHEAREAYTSLLRPIFSEKLQLFTALQKGAPAAVEDTKRESQTLKEAIAELVLEQTGSLEEPFFDNRPDSTNVFVISTRTTPTSNKPALLRSYLSRRVVGAEVPPDLSLETVLLATITAPIPATNPTTPFRQVNIPPRHPVFAPAFAPGLYDLGTAKNNPVWEMYYECRKLYDYTNDTMILISLGTGRGAGCAENADAMARDVEARSRDAANLADTFEERNWGLMREGWMKYFRFEVDALDGVPLEEGLAQDEIVARTTRYLAREDVGGRFYMAVDAICRVLSGGEAMPCGERGGDWVGQSAGSKGRRWVKWGEQGREVYEARTGAGGPTNWDRVC